jgi:hypothetical protein
VSGLGGNQGEEHYKHITKEMGFMIRLIPVIVTISYYKTLKL